MFCPQCGESQQASAKFCHKCGFRFVSSGATPASTVPQSQTAYPPKQGRGGIILTLGILSVVLFGPLTGIPAWIMGHGDVKEIRAGRIPQSEHGLTTAGMVLGIVGTCIGAIVIIGIFLAIAISIVGASRL